MGNSTSDIKKANFDDIINILKDSAKKNTHFNSCYGRGKSRITDKRHIVN